MSKKLLFASLILFVMALLFSTYIFLVPTSIPVDNTLAKLGLFTKKKEYDPKDQILILRGDICLKNNGDYTIEFQTPFAEKPGFEIMNPLGYHYPPKLLEVAETHATVKYIPSTQWSRTFRWIAWGKPLYPLKVDKVLEP